MNKRERGRNVEKWIALLGSAAFLKAAGTLILGLLGTGGLVTVFVKWLEIRDGKNTREMAQEDTREAGYIKRIAELEAAHAPLIRQAALLEPCQQENARLQAEVILLKQKCELAQAVEKQTSEQNFRLREAVSDALFFARHIKQSIRSLAAIADNDPGYVNRRLKELAQEAEPFEDIERRIVATPMSPPQ
jgi:hypothetical protein